jgi:hypothetical protein
MFVAIDNDTNIAFAIFIRCSFAAQAAKHDEYIANYIRTGEPKVVRLFQSHKSNELIKRFDRDRFWHAQIGKERTLSARHKNGTTIDVLLSVTEHVDAAGMINDDVVVVFRSSINNPIYERTTMLVGKKLFVGMMHPSKQTLEKKKKERTRKHKKDVDGATSSGPSRLVKLLVAQKTSMLTFLSLADNSESGRKKRDKSEGSTGK